MNDLQVELEKLYRHRFSEDELPSKMAIWRVLCSEFFQQWVKPTDTLVDVGAGYCEFINNIEARQKIAVDLNPRLSEFAAPGVETRIESCTEMASLATNSADVVFMSNFLEHLPSKDIAMATLKESRRVLRPGGRLIILQPNIRFVGEAYWDFFDHQLPLTDKSLVEAMGQLSMELVRVIPRFLPYTTKSLLPQAPWLVRLYLKIPLVWYFLGKQSLIVAQKP